MTDTNDFATIARLGMRTILNYVSLAVALPLCQLFVQYACFSHHFPRKIHLGRFLQTQRARYARRTFRSIQLV